MASGNTLLVPNTDEEFQELKATNQDKLLVIDFFATWCGPCRSIAPKFSQLSLQFPSAVFIKVDVDKCQHHLTHPSFVASLDKMLHDDYICLVESDKQQIKEDTSRFYQVSAMPTFVLEYRSNIKAKVKGADPTALENKIEEVSRDLSSSNSGSDSSLVPGMVDLEQFVVEKNCLNEDEEHLISNVFQENKSLYLQSDCDPELIISLTFNQKVKLHSLVCVGPAGGKAPKTVKLFINQPNAMDFDSARDATPLQEVELDEAAACSGDVVALKFVKLQSVDNVTLFLPDNQGDEETTVVERLILYGKPVNTVNMGDFKRVAGKKGESH